MHFHFITILSAACVLLLVQGCDSSSRPTRYLDPHANLNPESEKELRDGFARASYESNVRSIMISNSHWIVVSAYPYRSLNRFDVYVFEHPTGGVPGQKYGYYLRAFFVAYHSDTMKVEFEPEGSGLRFKHAGKTLGTVSHLDLGGQ